MEPYDSVTRSRFLRFLPILPVVLFVVLFALLPSALLFSFGLQSVGIPAGLTRLPFDSLNARAIENSFAQGSVSAVFAVVAGYPLGVLIGRYAWPGKSLVQAVLLVPFLLPNLVVVLGVKDLFSTQGAITSLVPALSVLGGGFGGIVTVNVFYNAPIVALLTVVGVESSAPELEDAVATLGGGPFEAYRSVWGPPSWIGAAAGGLLTFLFSALAFAAPLLMCGAGCYTVEAWIWSLDQQLLAPGTAAALALLLVLLLLPSALAYLVLWARLRPRSMSLARRIYPIPWRRPVLWPLLFAAGVLVASVAALLLAVILRSLVPMSSGAGIGTAWAALFNPSVTAVLGISTVGALGNTFFFAAVSAALALLFGLLVGYSLGGRLESTKRLQILLFLPLLISPVVLSFGLAEFWRPVFGGESMVWILIVISQTSLALPFALQSLNVALARIPHGYREVAQTLGSKPWPAYLDTEVPQVTNAFVTAGLFAFALSLGEFTATFFLATPRFTTLTVEIYRLQTIRLGAVSEALAGLLVLVSLATLFALALGGRRVEL